MLGCYRSDINAKGPDMRYSSINTIEMQKRPKLYCFQRGDTVPVSGRPSTPSEERLQKVLLCRVKQAATSSKPLGSWCLADSSDVLVKPKLGCRWAVRG